MAPKTKKNPTGGGRPRKLTRPKPKVPRAPNIYERRLANPPRRNGGMPTKLTPHVAETICRYIRMGCWIETAAEAAGIDRQNVTNWLKRGNVYLDLQDSPKPNTGIKNSHDDIYAQFALDVNQALADAEVRDLERIDSAAETIWQAAAWKLERRYPDRYAVRRVQETTGTIKHEHDHAFVPVDTLNLSIELRKALLEAMREQGVEQIALPPLPQLVQHEGESADGPQPSVSPPQQETLPGGTASVGG